MESSISSNNFQLNDKELSENNKIVHKEFYSKDIYASHENILINNNKNENQKNEIHDFAAEQNNSANTSDGISSIHEFLNNSNKSQSSTNIKTNSEESDFEADDNTNLNPKNSKLIINETEISRGFNTTKTSLIEKVNKKKKKNKAKDQGKNTENDISSIVSMECYSSLQDPNIDNGDLSNYSNNQNLPIIFNNSDEIMFAQKVENVIVKNFLDLHQKHINLNSEKGLLSQDSKAPTTINSNNNKEVIVSVKEKLKSNKENSITNNEFIDNNLTNRQVDNKEENENEKIESSSNSKSRNSSQIFSEIQDLDSWSASTLIESENKNLVPSCSKINSIDLSDSSEESLNENNNNLTYETKNEKLSSYESIIGKKNKKNSKTNLIKNNSTKQDEV